jgi:transposase
MRYVGMDVHSKYTTLCILDENGKIVKEQEVHGSLGDVLAALRTIPAPFAICYEASCGYGWLHDQLVALGARVVVAHPGKLRLIFQAKRKNDRIDARKLAKLLYLDEVPLVYVPSAQRRQWRELIEYRSRLVAKRTRVKNAIRALLQTDAIQPPKGLWTAKGQAWLKALPLVEGPALRRDIMMEELVEASAKIRRLEVELKKWAAREPGVAVLRTIPGVGLRTAEAVVAYVADPTRFRRNKAVGCYFGLVPSEDTSVKARFGHITKEGPPTVRRLVAEATWQGIRRDAGIRAYFERITHGDKDRRKIAVVATAHHLLRVMLAMLRTGECYRAAA